MKAALGWEAGVGGLAAREHKRPLSFRGSVTATDPEQPFKTMAFTVRYSNLSGQPSLT
jgi:hypothetical protein